MIAIFIDVRKKNHHIRTSNTNTGTAFTLALKFIVFAEKLFVYYIAKKSNYFCISCVACVRQTVVGQGLGKLSILTNFFFLQVE